MAKRQENNGDAAGNGEKLFDMKMKNENENEK
jgi:hypothetical protein